MAEQALRERSSERHPDEVQKLRIAARQLEIAEAYLAAAVNVEVSDPREQLLRPRLVG
jgi:hypothetical protein